MKSLEIQLLKVDGVSGWVVVGHLIIVSLQVLPFEFLTILLSEAKSSLSDKWLISLKIQLSKVSGWVGGGGTFDYSVSQDLLREI